MAPALLEGCKPVMVDKVAHFVGYGSRWYGSPDIVAHWWQACVER
jgi:hypothetical protein